MKKIILFLVNTLVYCLISVFAFSQAPQSIPYQAVARDANGNLIASQTISLRFTIRDSIATGLIVFAESQTATTNTLGLFSVNIGLGTTLVGPFSGINWGSKSKFLQVELDVNGGTNYTNMGTTQLMSVPYALYAASSGDSKWAASGTAISNTNSGNVGIGITTPTSKLHVAGPSASFAVRNTTNNAEISLLPPGVGYTGGLGTAGNLDVPIYTNGQDRLTVKADGKIGIGTATPIAKLHVSDNTIPSAVFESSSNVGSWLSLGNSSAGGKWFSLISTGAGNGEGAGKLMFTANAAPSGVLKRMMVLDHASGNIGLNNTYSPKFDLHIDGLASNLAINSSYGNGIAITSAIQSRIYFEHTNGIGNMNKLMMMSFENGKLSFNSANDQGTAYKQYGILVLDSNGNIGIGHNSPSAQLELSPTQANRKIVMWRDPNNNDDHRFYGFGCNNGSLRYQVDIAAASHVFYAALSDTTSVEIMRMRGDGNVGIGTSGPSTRLDVVSPDDAIIRASTLNGTNNSGILLSKANAADWLIHPQPVNGLGNLMIDYAGNNQLFINGNSGNVGIGTTNPSAKLDVNGDGKFGDYCKIGTEVNEGYFQNAQDGAYRGLAAGGNQGYWFQNYAGAFTSMYVGLNGAYQGKVGIGTTTPTNNLSVNGHADFTGTVGIGASNTVGFNLLVAGNNNAIKLSGTGSFSSGGQLNFGDANYVYLKEDEDDKLTIQASRTALMGGPVGIGTISPQAPLHVVGAGITTPTLARIYFNGSSGLTSNTSSSGSILVRADGYYWANGGGFVATSDKRIKHIIGNTNTANDLSTLTKIQITDYKYIDEATNGSKLQKKVIAQQLQEVYPDAVNINQGVIPNVFETAKQVITTENSTTITTNKKHDFKTGDMVRLILEKGSEKNLAVTVIDEHTFSVEEIINDNVFVYGKKVNDLLNVDYDAVAMLNVSATQELAKRVDELTKENARLNAEMKSRLEYLEVKLNSINNEVITAKK